MNDRLTFQRLRQQNVIRQRECFEFCFLWEVTDWGCALAGEVGEACNIAKKIKRLQAGFKNRIPKNALAKELADVVIYADLMAYSEGIVLATAIKQKFNEVSKRVRSSTTL